MNIWMFELYPWIMMKLVIEFDDEFLWLYEIGVVCVDDYDNMNHC